MNPSIWGPKAWFFLHSVSFNYPDNPTKNDKVEYKRFFESIQYILPCDNCKEHFSDNFYY